MTANQDLTALARNLWQRIAMCGCVQTVKDTDAVIDACKTAGVQYMDATMWLHNPRTAHLQAVLQDPALMGPVKSVMSCFNFLGGCASGWSLAEVGVTVMSLALIFIWKNSNALPWHQRLCFKAQTCCQEGALTDARQVGQLMTTELQVICIMQAFMRYSSGWQRCLRNKLGRNCLAAAQSPQTHAF